MSLCKLSFVNVGGTEHKYLKDRGVREIFILVITIIARAQTMPWIFFAAISHNYSHLINTIGVQRRGTELPKNLSF